MNKHILKTIGLALLSTTLAACDGSDKHSDTSQSTIADQNGRIAQLEADLQQGQATTQQQGQQIVQITRTETTSEASSSATTDEIKTALAELQKNVAENPKFDPAKQQAIEDALGELQKQFDANPKFDPEALKTVQANLETLEAQFDASPKFDPAAVQNLSDTIAQLAKLVDSALDANPVRLALRRLLPNHYRQVTWVNQGKSKDAQDSFRVYGKQGAITIEGSSPAVILTALKEYLEQTAHVSIGWPGDSLDMLPKDLPAPTQEIKRAASVKDRFALNDTDDGYSDAYKSWPEWERKIDLLAMNGINEVFIPVGMEEVYRQTFREFGYTDAEIRAWIPATAHQPWWLLQNMSIFGGPMSPELFNHRVETGKKIINRLRDLGMTAVLPGYFGTVPAKFKTKMPEAATVEQGLWNGLQRPDWLDPRTDLFKRIAATFYAKQDALFGASTMYKMDPLHEGGVAGIPVGGAAAAIKVAFQTAHPGAIWVLLGWDSNPRQDLLAELKPSEVLIVDGLSDERLRSRESSWLSRPYAFGTIPNFGGQSTLGANASMWLSRYFDARDKIGSALSGIAYLPEASGNDPAAFELFTELAWRDKNFDQTTWFGDYATYRYGGKDEHAANAWKIIGRTAYSMDTNSMDPIWTSAQDSLFAARPDLDTQSARGWAPKKVLYDAVDFAKALPELMQIAPELRGTSAYRHDLVDVTRQVLANQSRVLLPKIEDAFYNGDASRLKVLTDYWLDYMKDLDALLATDPEFLLGKHLAGAKAAASSSDEEAQLLYDQRSIITTWGDRAAADDGGLRNYANHEFSGLVSGLYTERWSTYFKSLNDALANDGWPDYIDWFPIEDAWARKKEDPSATTTGDAYTIAQRIADKIAAEPK